MPRRVRPIRLADPNAQAQRVGLRDYAAAADGGEPVHIRTFDAINDRFKYTAAGKQWVADNAIGAARVDYVPLIPVFAETLRRNGTVARYAAYFPVANLPQDIDNALFRAQRTPAGSARRMVQDLVKPRVLTYMKENNIGEWPDGRNLETVHVESDQRLVYRPDAPWRYNLLETEIVDGETRDSVTLQQPLFSETPWRMSAMLRVEDVIKECWMPSGNCVVSQISAHLKIPRNELEEHLDSLHKGWREEGVLPKDVLALAKLLHRSCYLLGENRLLLKHEIAT